MFGKKRFWSKSLKISIFGKIFEIPRICSKLSEISIFDKIGENFKLAIILEKPRFYSKYLDFGPNFRKCRFSSKFRKFLIDVKLSKNPDFGENRKIAILVKIDENFKFRQNPRKISILFEASRFWSKFPKISILVKIFENSWLKSKFSKFIDLGHKFRKIAILGQNLWKSLFCYRFS